MATTAAPSATLDQIDTSYKLLGCLGQGTFSRIFLAEKKNQRRRRVAIKILLNEDEEERNQTFQREIDAVVTLTRDSPRNKKDPREQSIVYFREWFKGPDFACIVMNFADGGTLAQEIAAKSGPNALPYTERRIAWYASQLAGALAYAHERGVAHHDVKSSNVLIDWSAGGKLILADFGTAVGPGEESVGFTRSYASPELLGAHTRGQYDGLRADKIDAFGLGCIMFELLSCKKLEEIGDGQTLASYIQDSGVDDALQSSSIRLPWAFHPTPSAITYSKALHSLIKGALLCDPAERWNPSQILFSLEHDPESPLTANALTAALGPVTGDAVTVDNVQLGTFVQRGQDWKDGDDDGGLGNVGVVVRLDPDSCYTWVSWPSQQTVEPKCYRIGVGNVFELMIGPSPLSEFVFHTNSTVQTGVYTDKDTSKYKLGQTVGNGQVMAIQQGALVVFAPKECRSPASASAPSRIAKVAPDVKFCRRRNPKDHPEHWELEKGHLAEVTDRQERGDITDLFFSLEGGMDIQHHAIVSIKRVQHTVNWSTYACHREVVAEENWGIANEQKLFFGTGTAAPVALVRDGADFYAALMTNSTRQPSDFEPCFFDKARQADRFSHKLEANCQKQLVLARVTLGRIHDRDSWSFTEGSLKYHSEEENIGGNRPDGRQPAELSKSIRVSAQMLPEYIITYGDVRVQRRRVIRPRRPGRTITSPNATPLHRVPLPRTPDHTAGPEAAGSSHRNRVVAGGPAGVTTPIQGTASSPRQLGSPQSTTKARTASSPSKMCVVCWSQPVCRVLLPCGHTSLCLNCSTKQGLARLGRKCPECRAPIREAATFYGRVVND